MINILLVCVCIYIYIYVCTGYSRPHILERYTQDHPQRYVCVCVCVCNCKSVASHSVLWWVEDGGVSFETNSVKMEETVSVCNMPHFLFRHYFLESSGVISVPCLPVSVCE